MEQILAENDIQNRVDYRDAFVGKKTIDVETMLDYGWVVCFSLNMNPLQRL